MQYLFGSAMFITALFLILLVLVQRGRGGGLAGAFGGMGGQSAFGAKAGDLFTRITMVVATVWIVLCVLATSLLNQQTSAFGSGASTGSSFLKDGPAPQTAPGGGLPSGLPGGSLTAPDTATDALGSSQESETQPGAAEGTSEVEGESAPAP